MPHEHGLSVPSLPHVQVPLLPEFAPEAAPHHAEAHPELARQRRSGSRVPERIRRVQHVEPAAPAFGVRRPEEQVPYEPLARRNLLIGKHVPRPDLQPASLDECPHPRFALRSGAEEEPQVKAHTKTGRLQPGPWYVLPDEQIPSGE